jgi:hypothetical protein
MNLELIINLVYQISAIAVSTAVLMVLFHLLNSDDSEQKADLIAGRQHRREAARARAAALAQADLDGAPILSFTSASVEGALGSRKQREKNDFSNMDRVEADLQHGATLGLQPGTLEALLTSFTRQGGSEMKSVKSNGRSPDRIDVVGRRMLWVSWVGLALFTLMLTACNFPVAGQEAPTPTQPALNTASLKGIIWQDACPNLDLDRDAPPGCIPENNLGRYVANGMLDAGEAGIAGAKVSLGIGACPSSGLAEVRTDESGRFVFSDLLPSRYCVSADIGGSHLQGAVEPGIWTNPASGMQEIALGLGEQRSEVNFGWDPFDRPDEPTPTPTPTIPPTPARSCSDAAGFIKDVTIPDGKRIDPGDDFGKTWRLRNEGTCTWTRDYDLVFISGQIMGGDYVIPLTAAVAPDQTVDLSLSLTAPKSYGVFTGYWMLRNDAGGIFGVGQDANSPVWVRILVEPEIRHWRGEYFDNMDVDGDPLLIRDDEQIDFNWGKESPAKGLPSNQFSVRWTRRIKLEADIYRFSALVDDGVRLWVDDRLVIDAWELGTARTLSVDLWMSKGKHDLRLEYFEKGGDARIRLDIDELNLDVEDTWVGSYFFNRSLDSAWARIEKSDSIDFNWGSDAPMPGLPKNDFSVRWRRTVDFDPGVYRFTARADDGIRAAIDGDLIIDEWRTGAANETYEATLDLSGSHKLTVEYFEKKGKAEVFFDWERIAPLNRPPVGTEDAYQVQETEVLIVTAPGVLKNDHDPDGNELTARMTVSPQNGQLVLDPNGALVYRPAEGFVGEDGFTYVAEDGQAVSEPVRVVIRVTAGNTPPVANDDSYRLVQDETLSTPAPGLLDNDEDEDGDSLSATLESPPDHGTLELKDDGSFTYTPAPGFSGEDRFTYRASDGKASSAPAQVTLIVVAANAAPVASDDAFEVQEDELLVVDAPGILENDADPEAQPLEIILVEMPRSGSLELGQDGGFEYTPNADFFGEDSFTYQVSDGELESAQALVTLRVLPVNDAPQAFDDEAVLPPGGAVEIEVLANDLGLGDAPLSLALVSPPANGSVELLEDAIRYTPIEGWPGEDAFEYAVTDADGESSQARVSIVRSPEEGDQTRSEQPPEASP